MTFSPELLDQLLAGRESPEGIFGAEGLFGQLKKALAERVLAAELGHPWATSARGEGCHEPVCQGLSVFLCVRRE